MWNLPVYKGAKTFVSWDVANTWYVSQGYLVLLPFVLKKISLWLFESDFTINCSMNLHYVFQNFLMMFFGCFCDCLKIPLRCFWMVFVFVCGLHWTVKALFHGLLTDFVILSSLNTIFLHEICQWAFNVNSVCSFFVVHLISKIFRWNDAFLLLKIACYQLSMLSLLGTGVTYSLHDQFFHAFPDTK